MAAQRELATLGGHEDWVCDVAFAPDERSVLTLSRDGKIKVWDIHGVLTRGELWRATNSIGGFAVSADERAVATRDSLGVIEVRDLLSGREIRTVPTGEIEGYVGMAFSPTEHILAWAGFKSVGILDYPSGQTNAFPISRPRGFCDPAFSPNGRELAFPAGTNIMIWDLATRKIRPFAAVEETVFGLAFSPNGACLASTHDGGALVLWDRRNGHKPIEEKLAHFPADFDVEFSPDGRLLSSGGKDGTGKIWELVPGALKLRYILQRQLGSLNLSFSPDGRRLVTDNDQTLKLWDTQTGLEVGTLYGHRSHVVGFAFSRDGNTLYSAAQDGEVRIWRAPPSVQLEAAGSERTLGNPELQNFKNR
jgi:WD40 repeat protein